MTANLKATGFLQAADPVLKDLIARFGPLPVRARRMPPFHALVQAIAHQQLNGKAAKTILGRFHALFPHGGWPEPAEVLALTPERICSCGFSRRKTSYVRDIAERAVQGLVPSLQQCDAMADPEIVALLTEIKGVGRWTAEMFLIFNLGRPDVLPVHDFGLRRGFQVAYRKRALPEPRVIEKYGARWSPFRTTASLYLYQAADATKPDA